MRQRTTMFLAAFVLCSSSVFASQDGNPEVAPMDFVEVIQVKGATKGDLFTRAKIWFVHVFIDSKKVLEGENPQEGLLVGKGSIPFEVGTLTTAHTRGEIIYTLKIMVKDGRYRYELADFRHHAFPETPFGVTPVHFGLITTSPEPPDIKGIREKARALAWLRLQESSRAEAERLVESIKSGMLQPSPVKQDW